MTNLVNATKAKNKKRIEDFIFEINKVQDLKGLDTWQFNELLPKGKKVLNMTFTELKAYLIGRKEKEVYKSIEREVNKINAVFGAGLLTDCKITVEWKRSAMWGSNPSAECYYSYIDATGEHKNNYVESGSIGGCGYDKCSTAVAKCLNQINEVLKPFYTAKNNVKKTR
jgi:hypothetical protein